VKLVPPVVERGYYAVTGPLVRALVRSGVRPNTITTIGTMLVVASAVGYGLGAIRLGGLLLLLSGLLDTLDGAVARESGAATKFGAFYDSTLDRIGDGATFIGIASYLLYAPDVAYRSLAIILAMIAILASLVVSYARARAEGLGIDCRVGIAQRAERIIGLGLVSLVVGAGQHALILEGAVALLAVASIITVVQRFYFVYRVTQGGSPPRRPPDLTPVAPDTLAKG
jgi:CDP-diacylglycerol--glycerol-3-phosphate 3-phosphatidyltransferase